ncbi:AsnC family transcriptional regulator [Candidatus Pacearchaeota archaeon]|nr:AsnC family transcriptional regulator [Candidatus Pacearchaeota archaeon]
MNLDIKDRRILYELDKNARASFSEIAKRIKLSKNSVISRIKKLEEEEIILNYNGVININHLGYTTYDIYLKFQDTTPEKEKEIINLAVKNKKIWLVGKLEGIVNLVLFISTKTPEEFYEIWDSLYQKIKKNVKVMRIAILLEYHHFTKEYLLGSDASKRIVEMIGKKRYVDVDNTDVNILKQMANDARISLIDLSEKFKLTPKTIRNRIKRLEKEKVILGYKININFQKLGYEYYKVLLTLNNLGIREELYMWILRNPNVVYYDKFLNGADFEFDVEISSFKKFVELLENLKQDFKKSIKEIEWFSAIKIYKSSYF